MSDLISTQELVAKIVDTAIRKISSGEQKLTKEYEQSVKETIKVILDTARCEIVRCKDCKYWRSNTQFCMMFTGMNVAHRMPEDGFCSLAERREDEML